jgi:acetyl-CoA carboxylase alpha subunit
VVADVTEAIRRHLADLADMDGKQIAQHRHERFRRIGPFAVAS